MGHELGFAEGFEHTLSLFDQCHKWLWFTSGIQRYTYIYVYIYREIYIGSRTYKFPVDVIS